MTDYIHVPLDGFLLYLAQGWRLPFVVQPAAHHHGRYSITVWRPADA